MMFVWFAYWNPTSPDRTFNLNELPDSVDFVSNWGPWNNLSDISLNWGRAHDRGIRMTMG